MIHITEKDLFTFVFYTDQIQKSKYDFILANLDKFSSELELLIETNAAIDTPLDPTIIKKIEDIIKFEFDYTEIILVKEQKRNDFHSNDFLLAAASIHAHKNKTETYIDSQNRFLAKIILNQNENKLFLFAKNQQEDQSIKLKLLPSNNTIIGKMKDFPLLIPQNEYVDKIILNLI